MTALLRPRRSGWHLEGRGWDQISDYLPLMLMGLLAVVVNVDNLVASLVYSLIGLAVFVAGLFVFRLIMPFDVHKEIEVDQNTALGIVMGSFIIGLAIIVAAAISG